jgi:hypothetical protein
MLEKVFKSQVCISCDSNTQLCSGDHEQAKDQFSAHVGHDARPTK